MLIGVSVVAAVLLNYWLLRFAVAVTGAAQAALLPPLVWFGLMLVASDTTAEGDILLAADNWVALSTIFAGSIYVRGGRLPHDPVARRAAAASRNRRPCRRCGAPAGRLM